MLHFPSPDIGMFGRRQRHARGHRIPVTIMREAKAEPDSVVVVDSFGAHDVTALPGGCACCTVRSELQSALRRLLDQREKSPFRRVAIQSRQDLGPIQRTFVSERALGAEFHVEDAPPLDGQRFVLTEDTPLSWAALSRFVTTLTTLRGADLLHASGLMNIDGCRGPVVVQFMGHLTGRPFELQSWPEGARASRLKFVTRSIDERTVRDLFDATCSLA